MMGSCSIQKNVNMTIKDDLQKIKELAAIDRDHSSAMVKEDQYQNGLAMTEECRRKKDEFVIDLQEVTSTRGEQSGKSTF